MIILYSIAMSGINNDKNMFFIIAQWISFITLTYHHNVKSLVDVIMHIFSNWFDLNEILHIFRWQLDVKIRNIHTFSVHHLSTKLCGTKVKFEIYFCTSANVFFMFQYLKYFNPKKKALMYSPPIDLNVKYWN